MQLLIHAISKPNKGNFKTQFGVVVGEELGAVGKDETSN